MDDLDPGAQAPVVPPTPRRFADLQELARTDPVAAVDAAWVWFTEIRDRAPRDRGPAEHEANELFRLGTLPDGPDGSTRGMLVGTTTAPGLDPIVKLITDHWIPWTGKRFDKRAQRGDNNMRGGPSALVVKVAVPGSVLADEGEQGRRQGFEFKTYIDRGADDPDRRVGVIDYRDEPDNPRLIKAIRDEYVEIVPGAYLGKVLLRTSDLIGLPRIPGLPKLPLLPSRDEGAYVKIGFFALRTPGDDA
ncbi:hypothetical protein P0W64_21600 [Tsukamurella sp. 8F]|uniref:hypothetical protein n=1 Tax=unclassified Tsukamurella TaxID=2633480 RepID=UPI0023B8A11B|nr:MULTISPECIES: hypothetical protein [unclassified Tsukamurella]MDF0532373.1 hypothetical protein [Tsukamurella sp. 8J]MDF0589381.1 hypothetical protein [Tsukamurella sp. 8F]